MYLLIVTSVFVQVFTSFNSLPELLISNFFNLKYPGISITLKKFICGHTVQCSGWIIGIVRTTVTCWWYYQRVIGVYYNNWVWNTLSTPLFGEISPPVCQSLANPYWYILLPYPMSDHWNLVTFQWLLKHLISMSIIELE